jgi:hypothetical protein
VDSGVNHVLGGVFAMRLDEMGLNIRKLKKGIASKECIAKLYP